jgi:hypothetical protein
MKVKYLFFWGVAFVYGICFIGISHASDLADRINISGYGNTHFMTMDGMPRRASGSDINDATVQLREFSLFVDANVAEGVIASVELEAGDNGNNYSANYAYADIDISTMLHSWDSDDFGNLSFRIGKILVPFLSYNENKVSFKQNLMSAPFTAQNFAPVIPFNDNFHGAGWADVGAMLNWNYIVGELGIVDLKAAIFNGLNSDTDVLDDNTLQLKATTTMSMGMMTSTFQPTVRPRDGFLQNEDNKLRDNNDDKASVVKLTCRSLDLPLEFGASWYRGAWDDDSENDLQMLGAHLNLVARDWSLKGEYGIAHVEQEEGINPISQGPAAINRSTNDYNMQAWYVEGSVIPFRYGEDDNNYLRLVFRFDDVDTNDKADFTPWDRWRITPGMEWQFINNSRLRYEFNHAEIENFGEAPQAYKDSGGTKKVQMHMASFIFSF